MNTALLVKLLINGVIVGSLYGVVAMSFVLIYKASKVVNFAQGEFLIVGAFACLWLATSQGLPFYAAFGGAVVFYVYLRGGFAVAGIAPFGWRADYFGDNGNGRFGILFSGIIKMVVWRGHFADAADI